MRLVPDAKRSAPVEKENGITRRQVLRWGLVGGVAVLVPVSVPGCGDDGEPIGAATPTETVSFLSPSERERLRAMVDAVLAPDEDIAALVAGVERYITRMLSALPSAESPGAVFAGGPFSGRNPYPDYDRGTPSQRFPGNDFQEFIPLNRWQRMAWEARLLGSEAVEGFDFNARVLGPLVGLRTQYRTGLQELEELSQTRFAQSFSSLPQLQRQNVLQQADPDFVALVTGHILEGLFADPAYGGNPEGLGWQAIGYDGDSQPLGYALFDRSTNSYRERADKPTSTANPDETFAPFPADIATLLRVLTRLAGSPRFP